MNVGYQTEKRIFLEALECQDARDRASFLDATCGGDPQLRQQVEVLLGVHADPAGFMDKPVGELQPGLDHVREAERPGSVIGRYKLLENIGEGGMGVVYLAEQNAPFRRRVALKVVKLGMDTRAVLARFDAERQALALMDHPNIARVLDGGATETGRPFFVMEWVQGVPITEFCAQNALGIEERLRLFIDVCHAVQHAHQKGIIHRDLKPSNVMVSVEDGGAPAPKVIDFGVAKALHQPLTEKTLFTSVTTLIGTPAYMSPEQTEMSKADGADVDTRSDIYSLGVMLYELLTGTPPFPEQRLRGVSYAEMQRIILHELPERPSARLRKARLTGPTGWHSSESEIPTDLDWIVLKCLEKDRNRRYETTNGLGEDLRRHLNDEPVVARPPSAFYRVRKAIRRNRLAFTCAALVLLALAAGMVATSWQALRAQRAEQAQARQTLVAERRLKTTLAFTDRLFRDVAQQLWQISGTAPVSEALATNGLAFLEELQGDADLTLEFRANLAQLYGRLAQAQAWPHGNTTADYAKGFTMATNAIHLLQSVGLENLSPARLRELSRVELVAGQAAERMFLFEEALVHARRAEALVTRLTHHSAFASEALTLQAAIPGGVMGSLLLRVGRPEEAFTNCFLPFLRAMQARGLDEGKSSLFDVAHLHAAYSSVGEALAALGRYAEAVPHFQEATRLMEVLSRRAPDAAEFASALPVASAKLAECLLASGDSHGLETVQWANQAAGALVQSDPRNAGFQETEVEVLRFAARGLIHWAAASEIPFEVRHSRLAEARDYLHRAEQKLGNLSSKQLRRWLSADFETARAFLESSERRWGTKEDISVDQEQGPHRPAPP